MIVKDNRKGQQHVLSILSSSDLATDHILEVPDPSLCVVLFGLSVSWLQSQGRILL